MNIDREELREAQLAARRASPTILLEQTKDARVWYARVAREELTRRERETAERNALTGVVEPL